MTGSIEHSDNCYERIRLLSCFDKCQRKSLQVGEVIAEEGECCNAGCGRGGRGRRRSWLITVTRTHHTALNAAPPRGAGQGRTKRRSRAMLHIVPCLAFHCTATLCVGRDGLHTSCTAEFTICKFRLKRTTLAHFFAQSSFNRSLIPVLSGAVKFHVF